MLWFDPRGALYEKCSANNKRLMGSAKWLKEGNHSDQPTKSWSGVLPLTISTKSHPDRNKTMKRTHLLMGPFQRKPENTTNTKCCGGEKVDESAKLLLFIGFPQSDEIRLTWEEAMDHLHVITSRGVRVHTLESTISFSRYIHGPQRIHVLLLRQLHD